MGQGSGQTSLQTYTKHMKQCPTSIVIRKHKSKLQGDTTSYS